MHQYPCTQVRDVELYDDDGLLQRGSSDGSSPSLEIDGPGPTTESINSDLDPAEVPVPDDGTDFDIDRDDFWAGWLAEIRSDEYDRFFDTDENLAGWATNATNARATAYASTQ